MQIEDLKKEKIAILGFSKEGVSSGEFLFRNKIPFTILEKKEKSQLKEKAKYLDEWSVDSRLGKKHLDKLNDFSLILRSPGVPLFLPQIRAAKAQGVEISSHTKLFFELCPAQIIGVTGTKGKGTTAMLLGSILKESGKKVFSGGNIGDPPLDFLEKLDQDSWVILELSSFQLEDFEKSPQIAIMLGLAPDHLAPESPSSPNFHKSAEDYYRAKKKILEFQDENDVAILNFDDSRVRDLASEVKGKIFYFSQSQKVQGAYVKDKKEIVLNLGDREELIGEVKNLILRGEHNWWNVSAAVATAGILDCPQETIRQAVFSFPGYEHRLEYVGEKKEVKFYNDSAATNPEPCIAAIRSFSEPIILIAGGSEKGQNYDELGQEIAKSKVKLLYLIGDMAKKIKKAVDKTNFKGEVVMAGYPLMDKIILDCFRKAQKGDVILLSPACASFDMFENYRDRGNQFKKTTQGLKEHD